MRRVSEDKCYSCLESTCALIRLVRTRARGNREELEDKKELEETAKTKEAPNLESTGLSKLKTWNLNVKKSGECLVDPTNKHKTDLTLDKGDYLR